LDFGFGILDLLARNEPSNDSAHDIGASTLDPIRWATAVWHLGQLKDLCPFEFRFRAQPPLDLKPVANLPDGGPIDDPDVFPLGSNHVERRPSRSQRGIREGLVSLLERQRVTAGPRSSLGSLATVQCLVDRPTSQLHRSRG